MACRRVRYIRDSDSWTLCEMVVQENEIIVWCVKSDWWNGYIHQENAFVAMPSVILFICAVGLRNHLCIDLYTFVS